MICKETISLDTLSIINPLVKDYLFSHDKVRNLWNNPPSIEAVSLVLHDKNNFPFRNELSNCLVNQYKDFDLSAKQKKHVDLLKEPNTFTVCTAHQLCLFTGPAYFMYKIISVVSMCKQLNKKFPNHNFVPIYWMGSEDHDFEEINHCYVYGKKITWQNEETGAIGRRSNKGIGHAIEQLASILGTSENEQLFINELRNFFPENGNYGKSYQHWILHLFKETGLLVIDQDDALLKSLFYPIIKEELENESSDKALQNNRAFLEKQYHNQAQGRPVNLFYQHEGKRQRIEKVNNTFSLSDNGKPITLNHLLADVQNISPNVILRPLYQETVLPNVTFIGGPGEVSYWLQLEDVFKHFGVKQPLVLLRDMALLLPKNIFTKLEEWELHTLDLFRDFNEVAKELVNHFTEHELHFNEEKTALETLFNQLKEKALEIDKSLDKSVDAELQKTLNSFSNLEGKLIRAEKRKHEQSLQQLENIFSKVYPENTLQERHDSLLPQYIKNKETLLQDLEQNFNAINNSLKVFEL